MVLETFSRAGADDQIERFMDPAREVAIGTHLDDLRLEAGRLVGLLATGGDRLEERLADLRRLMADIEPLQHQRRQPDGKHHRLDILDPVAGEVADRAGMPDHAAMDEGKKAKGNGAAPEERRADETRGE